MRAGASVALFAATSVYVCALTEPSCAGSTTKVPIVMTAIATAVNLEQASDESRTLVDPAAAGAGHALKNAPAILDSRSGTCPR